MESNVYLFTDASFRKSDCRSNKTKMDIASVTYIFNSYEKTEFKNSIIVPGCSSSNMAEALAIKNGLKAVIRHYSEFKSNLNIKIYSDSLAVLDFIHKKSNGIKLKKHKEGNIPVLNIIKDILELIKEIKHKVQFLHVKGHTRVTERRVIHEYNDKCDKTAYKSLKSYIKNINKNRKSGEQSCQIEKN